jgi:hypothetical protein
MSVSITEIADEVVEILNVANRFRDGLTLAAERVYAVGHKLEELDTLKVSVVCQSEASARTSRTTHEIRHTIEIGIEQRVETTLAAMDPLVHLAEAIRDYFLDDAVMTTTGVDVETADVAAVYLPDHVDEFRAYCGVVAITFVEGR